MDEGNIIQLLNSALNRARDMDAPVNNRLQAYADALREHHAPFAEAVDRLVVRLERTGAGSSAPDVGDAMPTFLLPDEQARLVSLEDLLAKGPAVVAFHRGHWCPYCRINTRALAEAQDRIQTSGAQIVAITPERQKFTAEHKSAAKADFRILTDMDNGYALSLNLAIWVGAEVQQFMAGLGRDLASYQGNPSWFLPIPATFVVATSGRISARFVDPDYRRRMDIDAIVEAAKAAA